MPTHVEPVSRTERTMIQIRNALLHKFTWMTTRQAELIALAGAVAAIQTDAACGTTSNVDRAEFLALLDRMERQVRK